MKTVAFVPIKLNNRRCPGKNIRRFEDGTTITELILKTLLKVKNIDEIYVYCSDEAICEYLPAGVKFLKRDKSLDEDQIKGSQIYEKFLEDVKADIYVLSHTTSPFTKPESIEKCVEKVAGGEYDSEMLAERVSEFLWVDGKPVNYDPHDIPRTQDLPPMYLEASGAYVFPRETFMKYNSRIGVKPYIQEITKIEGIDIDYEEDFAIAAAVYSAMIKKGGCK